MKTRWRVWVACSVALFMLIGPTVSPAGAATGCRQIGTSVRKGSTVFNTTLYRMNHYMAFCNVQGFVWNITQIQFDYATPYDIDSLWSWDGFASYNTFFDYDASGNLKRLYHSDVQGHFSQGLWLVYTTNRYPRIHLWGDWAGNNGISYTSAG